MKPLLALAAIAVAFVAVAPSAEAGRSVARSRQVVRGHGAQAQVVSHCAPQLVQAQAQIVYAQPQVQAQFYYPAPQQVFLPQVSTVYAAPQVFAAPPVQKQVVVEQQRVYAQPQVVVAQPQRGRQVVKSRQVVRGNAASQAIVLPY